MLRSLYRSVDIEIPNQDSSAWADRNYLSLRPHVVRAVKEITVRDEAPQQKASNPPCRSALAAGSAETYLKQLLAQIPSNQLKSFSYVS